MTAGMNGFIRTKLALTEDNPLIKPFDEGGWAELSDYKTAPVSLSLALLGPLHERWVGLLRSLSYTDFAKTYRHPASGVWTLDAALAFFAWHAEHHTAHITSLQKRMGWR